MFDTLLDVAILSGLIGSLLVILGRRQRDRELGLLLSVVFVLAMVGLVTPFILN